MVPIINKTINTFAAKKCPIYGFLSVLRFTPPAPIYNAKCVSDFWIDTT